ncbi:MAG TPA: hypothetical protein VEH04_00085 [Verrucomicrobiae bacterium]|nr:hypothetical protein [Verrucomicrobiae bacterium]
MVTNYGQELLRFPLDLLYYGNTYYIERVARLEDSLADVPKEIHLEMMGDGEIDADWALVIREVLNQRSANTRLVTRARSSLKNGSALVWLLGDRRLIRDDARLFFRRANITDDAEIGPERVWKEDDLQYVDSFSEADPGEASHAQVLQYINEFLPVREFAGRIIDVPTLRQFGLVDNEKLDHWLAATLGATPRDNDAAREPSKAAGNEIAASKPAQE